MDWEKDPEADLPWHFDWSEWLEDGESITASVMTASAGVTLHDAGFSATDTTVWVTGGTVGNIYQVSNRITTSQAKIDERSIRIRVKNR